MKICKRNVSCFLHGIFLLLIFSQELVSWENLIVRFQSCIPHLGQSLEDR